MKTPSVCLFTALLSFLIGGNDPQSAFVGAFQRYWGPRLGNQKSDDILTIREEKGALVAVYDGEENVGEHGPAYFRVEITNIVLGADGTISFSMPSYELYGKPVRDGEKQESIGVSRPRAEYRGKLEGKDIVFTCISKTYDCQEPTMLFKRLRDSSDTR